MITAEDKEKARREETIALLHLLGIGIHRLGYQYLRIAAVPFAANDTQSLSKELYPYVAAQTGCADWRSVERAIRAVILDAWEERNEAVWEQYFPNQKKAPTNKQFLAVLAECIR